MLFKEYKSWRKLRIDVVVAFYLKLRKVNWLGFMYLTAICKMVLLFPVIGMYQGLSACVFLLISCMTLVLLLPILTVLLFELVGLRWFVGLISLNLTLGFTFIFYFHFQLNRAVSDPRNVGVIGDRGSISRESE